MANWQLVFKKCFVYHSNHLVNLLKVHQQELDNNLDMESLKYEINIDKIKHEELFSI